MSVVTKTATVVPNASLVAADVPLVAGNCLYMGAGAYISPITFGWGLNYTLLFRAKIYSTPSNAARLMSDPTTGQQIILTSSGIQLTHKSTSVASGAVLDLNNWHDYAVVFNNTYGIATFFRDGEPKSAVSLTIAPYTSAFGYYLFNRSDLIRPCDMDVRELQWYNRAFTPEEVVAHRFSDPNNLDSLVFRYKFDEGEGVVLKPRFSGYGDNAILNNGVWKTFTSPENTSTYGYNLSIGRQADGGVPNNKNIKRSKMISGFRPNNSSDIFQPSRDLKEMISNAKQSMIKEQSVMPEQSVKSNFKVPSNIIYSPKRGVMIEKV